MYKDSIKLIFHSETDGSNLDRDVCYSEIFLYMVFLDICKTNKDTSMKHDKEATSLLIRISSYQIILSGWSLNKF